MHRRVTRNYRVLFLLRSSSLLIGLVKKLRPDHWSELTLYSVRETLVVAEKMEVIGAFVQIPSTLRWLVKALSCLKTHRILPPSSFNALLLECLAYVHMTFMDSPHPSCE